MKVAEEGRLDPNRPNTQFMFEVGMALGRAFAAPRPGIPMLRPGQRMFQVWSEPDQHGYRVLLTFGRREEPHDI